LTKEDFTRRIIKRLLKFKFVFVLGGIIVAILLYRYAGKLPTIYSAKASVYPINSAPDNSATSKISELLGASGGNSKAISEEANVSIEEVAKSRKTREAVVAIPLPEFNNKTIALLLIEEYNKDKSFREPEIKTTSEESLLFAQAADLLKAKYTAKFNKNSLLEVGFSSSNPNVLAPITNILIDKISQFYKELKIEKAKLDYDFTASKVDSFDNVIRMYDRERIQISKKTLFVPPSSLEYNIPVENLENQKILLLNQRNTAAANKEDALWRLQKVTPIIKKLDTAAPPYDFVKPSKIMYAGIGFFIGFLFFMILFVIGLVIKFANAQVNDSISKTLAVPAAEKELEVKSDN
jgi:hypothetical protein